MQKADISIGHRQLKVLRHLIKSYIFILVMIADYGTDATMWCVSNGDSYQWQKFISGSYQYLQTSSSKYSISGKSLTIYNTNQNDGGFYRCVLFRNDNVVGIETPIELEVKGLSQKKIHVILI